MKQLKVDFSQSLGPIKAVNGVNNGPLTCNFSQDARPYFKEARIPFSRLHDTEYPFGSGEFVDVSCLFKNFNCDENDPANYNFTLNTSRPSTSAARRSSTGWARRSSISR